MPSCHKPCPFCKSKDTVKCSDFGTSVMVKQYYCCHCNTYFEWVKWGDQDPTLDLPEFLQDNEKG
ncbi:MAG: hypothetical protein ACE5HO_20570 [bacterium]